jgi:hypothetical protein
VLTEKGMTSTPNTNLAGARTRLEQLRNKEDSDISFTTKEHDEMMAIFKAFPFLSRRARQNLELDLSRD